MFRGRIKTFHKVFLILVVLLLGATVLIHLFLKYGEPKVVEIRADFIQSSLKKNELLALLVDPNSRVLGVGSKVELVKEFPSQKTKFGYNAVVVNWNETLGEESDIFIEVSSSEDGVNWASWQSAEEDSDSDGKAPPPKNENFSSLLLTKGNYIKYKVKIITDPATEGEIEKIKVVYIDSEEDLGQQAWRSLYQKVQKGSLLVKGAFAATTNKKPADAPFVISRSGWGADPKLMKWGPERTRLKKMFVHHTVTVNNDTNPAATIRAIYYFHSVLRKWGDIGYNFLVDSKGNIYEGRYGGDGVVGGHVYHYNYGSVGVGVLGDYRTGYPTNGVKNALQQIAIWKSTSHGFDPTGRSRFGSPGYEYTFANVTYHGDVGSTECAGANLNKFIPELRKLARQMPLEALVLYKSGSLARITFSKNRLIGDVLKDLRSSTNVALAGPNYIRRMSEFPEDTDPDDTNFVSQWNLRKIGQNLAWKYSQGTPSVKVAVLDTGVAYEDYSDSKGTYSKLPDFENTNFDSANAYDFVSEDTHANDDNGHGTAVADIIATTTNNTLGNSSISPNVTILPVKVLDKRGFGIDSDIARGIAWARSKGAKIVNLSLGGPENSYLISRYISSAYASGIVIVAAAGNNGSLSPFYPAASKYVLSVGSTRFDNARAYYSNYGTWNDLFAPGGDLRVDQDGDGRKDGILVPKISSSGMSYTNLSYGNFQGTSFSAAHVSGVAALLASKGIKSNKVIERLIFNTAKDLGSKGIDSTYRYGLVQVPTAIRYASADSLLPNGTLVRVPGTYTIYLLDQGQKKPFPNYSIFGSSATYKTKNTVFLNNFELSLYPKGSAMRYPDGTLLRGSTGPIYVLSNGQKRAFANATIFTKMGYKSTNIVKVSNTTISSYPTGLPINKVLSQHPDGSVVKATGAIYYIENGKRRYVSPAVFATRFKVKDIIYISTAQMSRHPVGSSLTFPDGTLLKGTVRTIWILSTPTGSSTQVRRPFHWWASFAGSGYKSTNIILVSDTTLTSYPIGGRIY